MPITVSHPPRRALLAANLLCAIAPSFAADQTSSGATSLDDVVVTATRTARTQDETLAAVSVITREQIDRLAPPSLPELLRGVPGLTLAVNGGPGKQASAFLRGTESDHLLVLVDGIRIGSATAGAAAFQDIPVEQIERIEIVRGPFSSLYGADALGGVIQIFTRRPHDAFDSSLNLGAGSYGSQRFGAGVAGRGDTSDGKGGWYSLHAAYESTDGIDAYRDNPASPWDDFGLDSDRDGYRNRSLSLSAGHNFSPAWEVDGRALRTEGHNQYDGSYSNESEVVQQVVGGRVRYKPSDAVALTLNVGRNDDLSDDFQQGVFVGNFNSHRTSGSLQGDFGVSARSLLTFGYDWRQDEVDSNTEFDRARRIGRGLFGQWQQALGDHSLQVSLRRDDDSQFGGHTTGAALWGWDMTGSLRLTASYGTAFKAPTFNELYFPFFGNPDLDPETSRSFELGLRGKHGWGGWSLNAFHTVAEDMIAFDPTLTDAAHPFGQPANIDRARIRGLEATANANLAGWLLQASATWLNPRNDGEAENDGNLLARRPRTSARVDVDRSFGDFSVGASVNGSGHRYDDPGNANRMGGYGTTDLRLGYALSPSWTVQLNGNNVFDKNYETVMFYPQQGRNWFVSVRFNGH